MITDVEKYSRFLITKDLFISKKKRLRVEAAKNNIELALPSNLTDIPLEKIIQLRNTKDFNDIRRAYAAEIEQLIMHQERNQDYSLKKLLSLKQEYIAISEQFFFLTAAAIVSAISFYSAANEDTCLGMVPAMASAVVDFETLRDAQARIPEYIREIKRKRLARKYIASIEQLNQPVRWGRMSR